MCLGFMTILGSIVVDNKKSIFTLFPSNLIYAIVARRWEVGNF